MQPSALGRRLLDDEGWDPFLEDPGSLWVLHWNLTSRGSRAATWYWVFNKFREHAFARAAIVEGLVRFTRTVGWGDVSPGTIKRDVDCFAHSYLAPRLSDERNEDSLECPLTTLGLLLSETDGDRLRLTTGPRPTLPLGIFAYSLCEFWQEVFADRRTLDVSQLFAHEGSPVRAFRLDHDSLLSYLDSLDDYTSGQIAFEDTAHVRRLVRQTDAPVQLTRLLETHYASR